MMEFEGLQQIWDAPSNQMLYVLDETALHKRILAKKKKSLHFANVTELMLMIVNGGAGCFVFFVSMKQEIPNALLVILAAWMWLTTLYILVSRIRRLRSERRFDRSMLGDLQHTHATSIYQVRISKLSLWNALLLLLYCIFMIWQSGKSAWYAVALGGLFVIVWRMAIWEHSIYKNRSRELEQLLEKLTREQNNS